jgi:hypothetical protein
LSPSTESPGKAQYQGPWHCTQTVVREKGIRGLFKGMSSTIIRDVPAYATQFWCYEWAKQQFLKPGQTTADLGPGPCPLFSFFLLISLVHSLI